jgi:hypothetical protein
MRPFSQQRRRCAVDIGCGNEICSRKSPLSPAQLFLIANGADKENQSQQGAEPQLKHLRRKRTIRQMELSGFT